MGTSINTNIAAYYAQANIQAASDAATSSVARLSSGNAIVNASDNVAALAIGTSLASQVSILSTAGTNATQGGSLLQVADGGLAQIQSILQQQQSIAAQAESGALTNTDRGFLNQQFQTLTNEINSLASGTTFNGVNLIDGSIAAAGTVGSTNPLVNTSADAITSTQLAAAASGFASAQVVTALTGQGAATYVTGAASGQIASAIINPPSGGANDTALTTAHFGSGVSTVTVNGTLGSSATSYAISYVVGGVTYAGTLLMSVNDGSVAAGATATLTATTNPGTHATITLNVGSTGYTGSSASAIQTASQAVLNGETITVGSISGTAISHPSVNATTYDTALQGDLSQGTFSVAATSATGVGTLGSGGSATGYTISYSINGVTYQGVLATTGAGVGATAAASTTVNLLAVNGPTQHSQIAVTFSHPFGATSGQDEYVDQSANITAALNSEFQNANLVSTNASAVITGTTATSGITAVSAQNDISKNDTALVGDLSTGTFNVTGSSTAGFSVSYTINGSTYQGSLSAAKAAAGGQLILDNGNGNLNFTIGASSVATATTASVLQSALSSFFTSTTSNVTTGATAYAVHSVATALATDSSGAIAGSAITSTATAGGFLAGFTGANVTLQSTAFTGGAANLPPLATFTATGSGVSTVFSVIINGVTYSTGNTSNGGSAVTNPSNTLQTATFDAGSSTNGTAGILTFFANGVDTSDNKLTLNLHSVTGPANINTTADVTNVVNALNSAFGSGGSTGGLTFQLGATSGSDVTVNIGAATTTALFGTTPLDISTQTGASTATATVGTALNSVTALRAGVGALESQFNFASAAIQSSEQNEDAARGDLLDTNIATESTKYAIEQVKLQAGISVLAQANQQLQALLKLIG